MLRRLLSCFVAGCVVLTGTVVLGGGKSATLLRVNVGKGTFEGKAVASNDREFWLMSPDGELRQLRFDRVSSFKKFPSRFKPESLISIRDELKRTYGSDFEVAAKGHYVVCGPRGRAREFAKLFDAIYNRFYNYFRVRRLDIKEPEFPMVALVFPDHAGFAKYAAGDGVRAVRGLMGYYHPHTNRVALFDPGDSISAVPTETPDRWALANIPVNRPQQHGLSGIMANAIHAATGSNDGSMRDTMIHEATHQIAFNTGLHTRIGDNPKWIVEGLATVYEAPGIREGGARGQALERINRERFLWFMNFAEKRRPKNSLHEFIADDAVFNAHVLDGYSQAWALSFYLIETRSSAYARYLKNVAKRDPLKPYRADERVEDFKDAFGKNLAVLDASFLRYMKDLAASPSFR